ncbi:NnrU family protein [Ectothiorhodospira mobilis]|uniref:NnrU family protein n=1 Tax=Ectothiorhodospira mobilis TaxID=195064 RepID=UPI001A9225AF|nr:NnrU family protein [Ectothiorhodospira mobilis]
MILGLVLFLGTHSLRIFAEDWRAARIQQFGEKGWTGIVSLVSLVGFVLIVWGFGMARAQPVVLWVPPGWTFHVNALFSLVAFVFLAAAYVPGNHIKAWVGHPMVIAVKAWALGHLLSNGSLADILLFGSFLVWAILSFRAARKRDALQGSTPAAANLKADAITVAAGLAGYLAFVFFLHMWLIGRPVM